MNTFKCICVVARSKFGVDIKEFKSAAIDLEKAIAARQIKLVYGGGIQGLQGCVAASALKEGRKVLGIFLNDGNTFHLTYGVEIKVRTMYERLATIFHNVDAFIALPGGLEIQEKVTAFILWANRIVHKKPIGFLNVNGFYDHFLYFLDHAMEQKFMSQATRRIIVSAPNADQLFDKLQHTLVENTQITSQEVRRKDDNNNNGELDTILRL